jgi:hypothetical protein
VAAAVTPRTIIDQGPKKQHQKPKPTKEKNNCETKKNPVTN